MLGLLLFASLNLFRESRQTIGFLFVGTKIIRANRNMEHKPKSIALKLMFNSSLILYFTSGRLPFEGSWLLCLIILGQSQKQCLFGQTNFILENEYEC